MNNKQDIITSARDRGLATIAREMSVCDYCPDTLGFDAITDLECDASYGCYECWVNALEKEIKNV